MALTLIGHITMTLSSLSINTLQKKVSKVKVALWQREADFFSYQEKYCSLFNLFCDIEYEKL